MSHVTDHCGIWPTEETHVKNCPTCNRPAEREASMVNLIECADFILSELFQAVNNPDLLDTLLRDASSWRKKYEAGKLWWNDPSVHSPNELILQQADDDSVKAKQE